MPTLNPNHPVAQAVNELWPKLVMILMHRLGVEEVVITDKDVQNLAAGLPCIATQELEDGLHLKLVDWIEGERLAREHGGLLS